MRKPASEPGTSCKGADVKQKPLLPLVLAFGFLAMFAYAPSIAQPNKLSMIALATAANIGSTATITGNPQNIYIGSHSGISYLRFAEHLLPLAALGLVLNFLMVAFVYRRSLFLHDDGACLDPENTMAGAETDRQTNSKSHRWLQRKMSPPALS